MSVYATDRDWLRYQYADADRLRLRHEAHARHSENRGRFFDWLIGHLAPLPEELVADVGCGHGAQHPALRQSRVRLVAMDLSPGMTRETRDQALALGLPVQVLRGDAERLPLADGACDRVMANHVLFHVPDRQRALEEMKRITRPGGRVVLATHAADNARRLRDLHDEVASALGYTPSPPVFARFHLGDLPLVEAVFPGARLNVRHDAFVFPDVDSALSYYASQLIDRVTPLPEDGSHRPRLLQMMAPEIQKIIDTEGVFRVPKNAGCFVADV